MSDEISHLMRDKGYPQKRAVAASLAQARAAGCPVGPNPNENPVTRPGELRLWKLNERAGYWDYQRSVTEDTADAWRRRFQIDDPRATFKVSRGKPAPPALTRSFKKNPDFAENPFSPSEKISLWIAAGSLALGVWSLLLQTKQVAAAAPKPVAGGGAPLPSGPPGGSGGAKGLKLLHKGDSWSLIGDSIAQGIAPRVAKLSAAYGAPFDANAIQSTTILSWAQKILSSSPTEAQRDVVVIELGTNDAYFNQAVNELPALVAVTDFYRQKGATVVWALPPILSPAALVGPTSNGANVAQLLLNEADTARFILWDPGAIPIGPDKVHPTAAGYDLLAQRLFSFLTQDLT